MNRKITAGLLVSVAVLTSLGFTALGSVFNYPDVLKEPPGDILTPFRAHQGAVTAWFTVLAISAALFGPIAVGVGRLSSHRAMRWAVPMGIAAAIVQVIGLARWPILIPGYAADAASSDPITAAAAQDSFITAHSLLGHLIGETFGYVFTAAWTILVLVALERVLAGRWFTMLGGVSAVLILAGVLSPLDVPGADLANFIGYLLFVVWLIAFAVLLLWSPRRERVVATGSALTSAKG